MRKTIICAPALMQESFSELSLLSTNRDVTKIYYMEHIMTVKYYGCFLSLFIPSFLTFTRHPDNFFAFPGLSGTIRRFCEYCYLFDAEEETQRQKSVCSCSQLYTNGARGVWIGESIAFDYVHFQFFLTFEKIMI
jgi:hypothetical protein